MIDAKELLKRCDIEPNKALGQNFLTSSEALNAILDRSDAVGHSVLEIGPGLGTLTCELCKCANRVLAIEIDAKMVSVLSETLKPYDNVTVLHKDFLDCNLNELQGLLGNSIVVVANLPYYVTTPICLRLAAWEADIKSMTLMVQQEAAERFFAKPKDRVYGRLSVLAQTRFIVSNVLHLSPNCYYPQPTVSSQVIHLKQRDNVVIPKGYFGFVTEAFANRRKRLTNNLSRLGKERITLAMEQCEIEPLSRAEDLTPDQFLMLYKLILDTPQ